MTPKSPSAFMVSAGLHAAVIALVLFFTYAMGTHSEDSPKVFELVAGEGDNYAATEAPKAGVPGGVKIEIPEPPAPIPTPPAPEPVQAAPVEVAPEPSPVKPAPVEKAKPKPVTDAKSPDFAKQIKRKIIRSESKAKKEVQKEREAEAKRISKLEFDRQNKARQAAGAGNPKVKHIDAEGIAGGVANGSANNKTGGAGGKALTREQGELMDSYYALVTQRLHQAIDWPPGLNDELVATADFRIAADGSLSGAYISKSSGNTEFDRAVLDAISRYRSIGPRPDHKSDTASLIFRRREEE